MAEGIRAERRAATAARILAAAQQEFGERGIDGATVRGIARRAGVDPSLVLQHYGTKQALFNLAVHPAQELSAHEVPEHLAAVVGSRLSELNPETRALMRSMLTSPAAASVMSDYLRDRVANLARTIPSEDAQVRAAAIVTSILGMTIARHFLDLEELADDRVESLVDPWLASLADATSSRPVSHPKSPVEGDDGVMDETSKEVHQHIDELVAREHALRDAQVGKGLDPAEQAELKRIEAQLDQAWDLLRQRNALSEQHEDPDAATQRPVGEVEGYLN